MATSRITRPISPRDALPWNPKRARVGFWSCPQAHIRMAERSQPVMHRVCYPEAFLALSFCLVCREFPILINGCQTAPAAVCKSLYGTSQTPPLMAVLEQDNEGLPGHRLRTFHPHAAENGVADDGLGRSPMQHSTGPGIPVATRDSTKEIPDEVYDRLPSHRKLAIVALLSFCSFLAPISSTSVLAATPDVASEFHTTGSIINLSNAFYLLFMGLSPLLWGPLSQVYGRRPVSPIIPPCE